MGCYDLRTELAQQPLADEEGCDTPSQARAVQEISGEDARRSTLPKTEVEHDAPLDDAFCGVSIALCLRTAQRRRQTMRHCKVRSAPDGRIKWHRDRAFDYPSHCSSPAKDVELR